MIEFKRNVKTGILEVWKDGVFSGDVITIGDKAKTETAKARTFSEYLEDDKPNLKSVFKLSRKKG